MARPNRQQTALKTAMYIRTAQFTPTALYVRKSVEEIHISPDPIEIQKTYLSQYLADTPELQLHKMYIDNGFSGTNFERPAFEELLEDIEAGKVKCVVFKDLSRLGRNLISTGYYLEVYFPSHSVRVISLNDGYDSEKVKNGIIAPITNLFNEIVAKDTSRKVKAALDSLVEQGKFIGGRPPYGYNKANDDCRQLVVNEEVAPIVIDIFNKVAKGEPFNQIVLGLNRDGIPTPSAYYNRKTDSKIKGCNEWHSRTLHKLLQDEVYIGNLVQGKSKKVNGKQVATLPDEWKRTNNTHEALVNKELFDTVQAVFAKNKAIHQNQNKKKTPYKKNIFSKKLFCAKCGRPLHFSLNRGKYHYICNSKYRVGTHACSSEQNSFLETKITSEIYALLKKQEQKIQVIFSMFDLAALHDAMEDTARHIVNWKQSIDEADNRLARLFDQLIKNEVSQEQFLELKNVEYERSVEEKNSFDRFNNRLDILEQQLSAYKNTEIYLKENKLANKFSQKMVANWIAKVDVASNYHLTITYSFDEYKLLEVEHDTHHYC